MLIIHRIIHKFKVYYIDVIMSTTSITYQRHMCNQSHVTKWRNTMQVPISTVLGDVEHA